MQKIKPTYEFVIRPPIERYPMSHAPYLFEMDSDHILLIWFAGSREWAKDVHLLISIFNNKTRQWSKIRDLVSDVGYSVGNSVVCKDLSGKIHLWYVRTKGYWHEGEIIHMTWLDFEQGFQSKEIIPLPKGWLIRGRPINIGNMMYLPVYDETNNLSSVWEQDLTEENGKLGEKMQGEGGLIHPTLVQMQEKEFRCFMRNLREPNQIHFAYSMNRGKSWSKSYPTKLPNPNSGIDVVQLSGSKLVCAYNDSKKNRYPLSLAKSTNAGVDWEKIGDIEVFPFEFSYPSLLRTGNALNLAYTYKREAIKFTTFPLEIF